MYLREQDGYMAWSAECISSMQQSLNSLFRMRGKITTTGPEKLIIKII